MLNQEDSDFQYFLELIFRMNTFSPIIENKIFSRKKIKSDTQTNQSGEFGIPNTTRKKTNPHKYSAIDLLVQKG
jgi:hypothetical protein